MSKLSLISNVATADKTDRFHSHLVLENVVTIASNANTTADVLVESVEHVLAHISAHTEQHTPIDALSQQNLVHFLTGLDAIITRFDKVTPESQQKMSRILLACRFNGDQINKACQTIISYGAEHGGLADKYANIVAAYYNDPANELTSKALNNAARQLRAKLMHTLSIATAQ